MHTSTNNRGISKRIPFLLLYLLLSPFLFSQSAKSDSLRVLLQNCKSDTARAVLLIEIAAEAENDSCLILLNEAKTILSAFIVEEMLYKREQPVYVFKDRGMPIALATGFARIQHVYGDFYDGNMDYKNSVVAYEKSLIVWQWLEQYDKDRSRVYLSGRSKTLNNLGNCSRRRGNYLLALNSYLEGLKIDERLNNLADKGVKLGNLGILYDVQGDNDKAIHYHMQSLEIKKKLGNKKSILNTLINLGIAYKNKNDVVNAQKYNEAALELSNALNQRSSKALVLGNIGILLMQKKEYAKAENYLNEALEIDRAIKNRYYEQKHLSNLGKIFSELKNYEKSKTCFESSLKIAQEQSDWSGIKIVSFELSRLHQAMAEGNRSPLENYRQALAYQQLYTTASDSVSDEEKAKEQVRIEMNYEFGKKEAEAAFELKSMKHEREMSEMKLQKELNNRKYFIIILVLTAIGLLIAAAFVFILKKSVRERKEAYIRLQEKNLEIQQQSEQLLKLSKEITRYQTQMNPHFVFNALNSIQGFVVNNQKEETLAQLSLFSRLMRQTLSNSSGETIALDKEIEYLKLYMSFEQKRFTNKIDFRVNVNADISEVLIPPMLIQPLIENSLKHAGLNDVKSAFISLTISVAEGDLLHIAVRDNGRGINKPAKEIIQQSHAVSILTSRMKLLFDTEGKQYIESYFRIVSVPEISEGTLVEFFLPLITKF